MQCPSLPASGLVSSLGVKLPGATPQAGLQPAITFLQRTFERQVSGKAAAQAQCEERVRTSHSPVQKWAPFGHQMGTTTCTQSTEITILENMARPTGLAFGLSSLRSSVRICDPYLRSTLFNS